MNDQDPPLPCLDRPPQEPLEDFSGIFLFQSMEVDVRLDGEISLMEPPGDLRVNIVTCTFDIFRRVHDIEAFPIFHQGNQLG